MNIHSDTHIKMTSPVYSIRNQRAKKEREQVSTIDKKQTKGVISRMLRSDPLIVLSKQG